MAKEFIVCAAYKLKEGVDLPHVAELKSKGMDPEKLYYPPHNEVFRTVQGWRHADILYKFGDVVDRFSSGGFMTSQGRYVGRQEAAEIAFEAGQIAEPKRLLYSEDIY